jgi:siroheme synthase
MLATAACKPGDPEPDWANMLRPGTSLAVYMGVRQAPLMLRSLREASVPMSLEVELVSKASTGDEKTLRCVLGDLTTVLKDEQVGNPAVILIRWPKEANARVSSVAAA